MPGDVPEDLLQPEPLDPAVAALAELARREAQDPLRHVVWTPTQDQYIRRPKRYCLLSGPNRGGKTACNAGDLALRLRCIHPTASVLSKPGVYLVFGTSRSSLRENWHAKLRQSSKLRGTCENFPMVPDWALWKASPKRAEKYSGSGGDRTIRELVCCHPEDTSQIWHRALFFPSADVETWKRIEGMDRVLGIYLDEVAGSIDLLKELYARLLESNSDPDIQREAGGGFLSWSATETKDNEAYRSFREKCERPTEYAEYGLFSIDPAENPAIDMAEREKMRAHYSAEDYELRMMGQGRFRDRYQVYPQLLRERHVLPTDYEPGPEDNLWAVYDPGWDHASGIGVFAVRREKPWQKIWVRYWKHYKSTFEYDIRKLAEWLRGRALEAFVTDPAAHKTEKGQGKKQHQMIREALQAFRIKLYRGMLVPYNRHESGIKAVRDQLDPDSTNPKAEPWLLFNPSTTSGVSAGWYELTNYCTKQEHVYSGPHGVIKKDDEFPDLVRYGVQVTNRAPGSAAAPRVIPVTWTPRPPNLPTIDAGAPVVMGEAPTSDVERSLADIRRAASAALAGNRTRWGRRLRQLREITADAGDD